MKLKTKKEKSKDEEKNNIDIEVYAITSSNGRFKKKQMYIVAVVVYFLGLVCRVYLISMDL